MRRRWARVRVECTSWSCVALCLETGCGARWLVSSRDEGYRVLAAHFGRGHPGVSLGGSRRGIGNTGVRIVA